ncbi:hypothetical protein BDM02DRAFT_1842166 [Thelephora ganbajun]|uniref:Uncharacterized protein n=1 Tax=Thelephora ganbajun TaxID=370292 RepID=A0ACB6YZL0_THEGA|nr:hypothetical protein BDM02DRAFT_1842166 [Thelephora ganbajun]
MALQCWVSELEVQCAHKELDDDEEVLLHHPEGVPSLLSSGKMRMLGLHSDWSELVDTPDPLNVTKPLFQY